MNFSLKQKLMFLSLFLLSALALVGMIEFYGQKKLMESLSDVIHVQLPAVSSMRLLDMYHDGLSKVVYQGLYASNNKDEDLMKTTDDDLSEMKENFKKDLAALQGLDVAPDIRAAISNAEPKIKAYVEKADEIVGLLKTNKSEKIKPKLAEFNETFDQLEAELGKLGDLIETESTEVGKKDEELAQKLKLVSLVLLSVSILLGLLVSWRITSELLKTFSSAIQTLEKSNEDLNLASKQGYVLVSQLSEATTEQASSLQETMASAEEISAMVRQNAESSTKVKEVVDSSKQSSDDGAKSIQNVVMAIDEIKNMNSKVLEQMEQGNREFSNIVKIIGDIGEKTKVINDIVFQTKLLSFNASVEAARAGEQGKGFAVVAEEVGNLAQMSGNAAKEITEMLSSSIKKVNEIVDQNAQRVEQLVEVGKDKVAMGQSLARQCVEIFQKIAENTSQAASMVSEITHASKEQAQGVEEINRAITQLDQVTHQTSAVAQKSAAQAEELNGQAQTMDQAVVTLVQFVHGGKMPNASPVMAPNEDNLKMKQVNNVVQFPKKTMSNQKSTSLKMTGTDSTPTHSDPGFEDL